MRSLSNLPPGGGFSSRERTLFTCPGCGHTFWVAIHSEFGADYIDPEDGSGMCPKCRAQGFDLSPERLLEAAGDRLRALRAEVAGHPLEPLFRRMIELWEEVVKRRGVWQVLPAAHRSLILEYLRGGE